MRQSIWCAGLLALGAIAVSAQPPEGSPTFEVASVKPAAPISGNRMMVRMSGGPGSSDPGQITYTNVSMKNLLTNAYGVKSYQISGPNWLDSERYDVVAKIAKGATKEQFQLMLQNLLAERFKLTAHHDTKELPIYALVVAKGGVKMKETPKDDPNAAPVSGPGPMSDAAGQIKFGKDGTPQLPPGGGGGGRGMMMMSMNGPGKMKMSANKQTTGAIAEMLANQLGRPVIDKTELTANYDYSLEYAPDENSRPTMMGAMMPTPPPSEGGGPNGGAADPAGPTLVSALQDQLGLKLEPRKGPVDLVVVDRLEKVPTEN